MLDAVGDAEERMEAAQDEVRTRRLPRHASARAWPRAGPRAGRR